MCRAIITKHSKKIAVGLLMCVVNMSFALQLKPIVNNGTATATVSNIGITRIAVANDRITDLKGPANAYTLDTDPTSGTVFIRPTAAYVKKPFTLFITTEQQHTYLLRLFPHNQNSDSIVLQPQDTQNPMASRWEQSSPYQDAITQLMHDMVNGASPEGYAVYPTKSKRQYLGNIAVIKLTTLYSGAHLEGLIYCVTNRTDQTIDLTEREFYQPGDRAIALENLTLPPKSQTWLYKVVSHG